MCDKGSHFSTSGCDSSAAVCDADEVSDLFGRALCTTSTNGYDANYAATSGSNGDEPATGNCASAVSACEKHGTPASRRMALGG